MKNFITKLIIVFISTLITYSYCQNIFPGPCPLRPQPIINKAVPEKAPCPQINFTYNILRTEPAQFEKKLINDVKKSNMYLRFMPQIHIVNH